MLLVVYCSKTQFLLMFLDFHEKFNFRSFYNILEMFLMSLTCMTAI